MGVGAQSLRVGWVTMLGSGGHGCQKDFIGLQVKNNWLHEWTLSFWEDRYGRFSTTQSGAADLGAAPTTSDVDSC